jgi:phosphatidate cytidylyltransferase
MASTELSRRVATGVVGGAALILLVLFGGNAGTALLAAGLSLGMVHELVEMAFQLPDKTEKRYLMMAWAWFAHLLAFIFVGSEFGVLSGGFLFLSAYFLFTARRHEGMEFAQHFRELMYAAFATTYLIGLPMFLALVRSSAAGAHWTLLFLFIVWAGDIGGYFGGKRFGRRKLYERISPKKTWEGAWTGLAAGLAVSILYRLAFFPIPWSAVVIVPLAVGVASPIGDLCESFLKRAFDAKDSGTILPGHGGFLDRFDGVVFSLPVMYACVRIFS